MLRAGAVQVDVDGGLVGPLVEARLRIVDAVAGEHHLPAHDQRLAAALGEEIAADRHAAADRAIQRARVVVDHADLERGGAAEDVLRAGRVLHARQLHDDALGALLLDDRLGHAQLVDAIAEDLDVLRDRAVLDALLRLGLQAGDEPQVAAAAIGFAELQVGVVLLDGHARLHAFGLVLEAHDDVAAFARDAGILDLFLAQQRPQVGRVAVAGLFDGRLHVDLQQEVHAAAEIEAKVHRQRADGGQPLRRRRQQVQRDDVVFAELRLQRVLGLELRVGIGQPDLDARRIERRAAVGNVRRLERVLDGAEQRRIDLRLGRRHLHRGHFRKEVGERVQRADQQGDCDDDVLPERVTVHGVRPEIVRCRRTAAGGKRLETAPEAGAATGGRARRRRKAVTAPSSCPWAEAARSRSAGR